MKLMKVSTCFLTLLGSALANIDTEESSLLQSRGRAAKGKGEVDCTAGKCKPEPTTTTTTCETTTEAAYTSTTTTRAATTTTTTTTTTTMKYKAVAVVDTPLVNPKAACSGVSCETVCAGQVLHFEGGNIVENNLAGGGRMKVVDVAEGVDLYVSDTSSNGGWEQAFAKSVQGKSGYAPGTWMSKKTGIYVKHGEEKEALRIAMEKTGIYEFKFELKNKAGDAVVLEEFPLVFYDIDEVEGVESCDHSGKVIAEDTALTVEDYDDWNTGAVCTKISARRQSAESPDDFDHLTEEQARASAAFIYENKSEWKLKLSLEGPSHRWFLFKSSKALACQ